MPIQARMIEWLLSVLAVLAVLYGAYHYGRHVESLEQADIWNKAIQAQDARNTEILTNKLTTIQNAEVQHDADQKTIGTLNTNLNGLRLHFPKCTSAMPASSVTEAGTNGASGVLSIGVDQSFGDLQDTAARLIRRCDQLNIDAIRLNGQIE